MKLLNTNVKNTVSGVCMLVAIVESLFLLNNVRVKKTLNFTTETPLIQYVKNKYYADDMYDGTIWWDSTNNTYVPEPYMEDGWFPEKEYTPDVEKEYELGKKSYFHKCFNDIYMERWKNNFKSVFEDLPKWIMLDPTVGFDKTCLPPKFQDPSKIQCAVQYPNAGFKNTPRTKPRKIGVAIQYGLEIDVLEMHLMELYDVVDKIFLLESVRVHRESNHKYLFWEHLKWTPRFKHFADKVVHFVIDETDFLENGKNDNIWTNEFNQEDERFRRVMRWNEKNKFFDDDDMISFGDTDEITSRHTIHALKYCDPEDNMAPIDVGSLFLNKRILRSQRTMWRVSEDHIHSYGDPTFYTFAHCKKVNSENKTVSRNRGRSGHYILGGTHATHYSYAPFLILKMFSCTECSHTFNDLNPFLDNTKKLRDVILQFMHDNENYENEENDIRGIKDGSEYYPWVLKCNPLRYRSFSLFQPDFRLYLPEEDIPFSC